MLSPQEQILAKILVQHRLVPQNTIVQIVGAIEKRRAEGKTIYLAQALLQHNYISAQNLQHALRMVERIQAQQNNQANKTPSINSSPFAQSQIGNRKKVFSQSAFETAAAEQTQNRSGSDDPLGFVSSPDNAKEEQQSEFTQSQLSKNVQQKKTFGHYMIEQELGRGGMGVVFKALDMRLGRTVALKVILGNHIDETKAKRFLEEAKATARLKHPHIVDLYEINTTPMNYFTMEFIDGDPLSSLITKGLKIKDAIQIIHKCAQALHFAHKNGIIHRDIKPANIMVGRDMSPKIMDFGLAKDLSNNEQLSKEGDILGTPAYMPPEQADGKKVDARSDVYSLGATMYQSLVGRAPFQAASYLQVLKLIYTEDPVPLRNLNRDIPIDIEAICLKCLEKKPEKRYPSANALAIDIDNFINNRSVQAKPLSKSAHLYKFVVRNKALSGFIALIICFILAFSSFMTIKKREADRKNAEIRKKNTEIEQQNSEITKKNVEIEQQNQNIIRKNQEIENARNEAEMARNEAIKAKERAERTTYYANILLANEFIKSSYPNKARKVLESCPFEIRNWEWHLLNNLTDVSYSPPKEFRDIGPVQSIALDSKRNVFACCTQNNEIIVYNLQRNNIITVIQADFMSQISSCKFSSKNRFFVATDKKGLSVVWNTKNWEIVQQYKRSGTQNCALSCIFTQDEKKLIVSYKTPETKYDPNEKEKVILEEQKKNIIVWDIASGKEIIAIKASSGGLTRNINHVILTKDQSTIIAASESIHFTKDDDLITFWDIKSGEQKFLFKENSFSDPSTVYYLAMDQQGRFLAAAMNDYNIMIWDCENFKFITKLSGHHDGVISCSFSTDGRYLASTGKDGNIIIWDTATWKRKSSLAGHQSIKGDYQIYVIESLFSNNDTLLISCGEDGVKFWEIAPDSPSVINQNPRYFPEQQYGVLDCRIHPHKDILAVALEFGLKIQLYDFKGNKIEYPVVKMQQPFLSETITTRHLAFSPDGTKIGSTGLGLNVLWNSQNGMPLAKYYGHNSRRQIGFCFFSPDGKRFATPGYDSHTLIWNAEVSPDEKEIVKERAIFALNSKRKGQNGDSDVNCLSFHPTKKILATCGANFIDIWNIDESKYHEDLQEKKIAPIFTRDFADEMLYCAYSPDGKYLLTTSKGYTKNLILWDTDIGKNKGLKPLAYLEGHNARTDIALFVPEFQDTQYNFHNRIVSGSKDGTLKVWSIDELSEKAQDKAMIISPILELKGHEKGTRGLSFTKDGKIMVSGGEDKQIKLWHIGKRDSQ